MTACCTSSALARILDSIHTLRIWMLRWDHCRLWSKPSRNVLPRREKSGQGESGRQNKRKVVSLLPIAFMGSLPRVTSQNGILTFTITDSQLLAAQCLTYCKAQCGAGLHPILDTLAASMTATAPPAAMTIAIVLKAATASTSIYWHHTATMRAVCSLVLGLRWGHHQPAISWWCMPVHNPVCFVSSCSVCTFLCVMCCYAQFALHTQLIHLTPCHM